MEVKVGAVIFHALNTWASQDSSQPAYKCRRFSNYLYLDNVPNAILRLFVNFKTEIPFEEDFEFVRLLIANDAKAWKYFYEKVRPAIEARLKDTFGSLLDDIDRVTICDITQEELVRNDCRVLRDYMGRSSIKSYIVTRAEWRARSLLRQRGRALRITDEFPAPSEPPIGPGEKKVMEFLCTHVKDDLRWAFLLRYFNDIDFPEDEIRKLSARKQWTLEETTARIARAHIPAGTSAATNRFERLKRLESRIDRLAARLEYLQNKIQRLEKSGSDSLKVENEAAKICEILERLKSERDSKAMLIETPYAIIGEILDEPNLNTIRSRVMQVKNQLLERFKTSE